MFPIGCFLVCATARADDYDLLAWSSDGNSALLEYHVQPNYSLYEIYTAGANDGDHLHVPRAEELDAAKARTARDECAATAATLKRSLATHKFRGIEVHADRCAKLPREILTISPDVAREASMSWVAQPRARTASAREAAVWAAAAASVGQLLHPVTDMDLATTNGDLMIVFVPGLQRHGQILGVLSKTKNGYKDVAQGRFEAHPDPNYQPPPGHETPH